MADFPDLGDLDYFTKRKLENEKGEQTGKILIFRMKGHEEFQIKLLCPECGNAEDQEKIFTRRPYRVTCSKCDARFALSKLSKKKKKK